MTHILVATDAWHPQVNGVVRTLTMMAEAAKGFGVDVSFLTPQSFRTFAMPSYPDLRLALPYPSKVAALIEAANPNGIHIATEATGTARRSGSVQVMISKRPSSCSASAVQLSTQSPQFM